MKYNCQMGYKTKKYGEPKEVDIQYVKYYTKIKIRRWGALGRLVTKAYNYGFTFNKNTVKPKNRDHYTFQGWQNADQKDIDSFEVKKSRTVRAKWEGKTYQVKLLQGTLSNGNATPREEQTVSIKYPKKFLRKDCQRPHVEGKYKFKGWSHKENRNIINKKIKIKKDIKLYPIYEGVIYQVIYQGNFGYAGKYLNQHSQSHRYYEFISLEKIYENKKQNKKGAFCFCNIVYILCGVLSI